MPQSRSQKKQNFFLLSFLITFIAIFMRGYFFPFSNHSQDLTPIMAMLDPALFANDFAVQDFLNFGTRTFYQYLVFNLTSLGIFNLPEVIFILNILSHFIFIFFSIKILNLYQEYNGQSSFYYAGVFFIFLLLSPTISWGNPIVRPEGIPSTFAMSLAIAAIYFSLKSNFRTSFLLASVTVLFHFLIGIYVALIIAVYIFLCSKYKQNLLYIFIFLCSSLTIFIPTILLSQSLNTEDLNFIEVFGAFRAPHHWFPSSASIFVWFIDLMFFISVLFISWKLRNHKKVSNLIKLFQICFFLMIFFMGLNYLFVEIYPIEFIGKLQFQRFIPFVRYLAILIFIISVLCLYRKPKKHIISTVLVILPFSIGIFLQDDGILFYSCGFLLFFLVALFSSKLSPLPLTAIIVMISILLNSSLIALNNKYYETRNLRLNIRGGELVDGNKTANFLKENSKKSDLILIPPLGKEFLDTFPILSERSVFVSYKNVPYSNAGLLIWKNRIEELIGVNISPDIKNNMEQYFIEQDSEVIENIAATYGVCFYFTSIDWHTKINGTIVFSEEMSDGAIWVLWELKHCR